MVYDVLKMSTRCSKLIVADNPESADNKPFGPMLPCGGEVVETNRSMAEIGGKKYQEINAKCKGCGTDYLYREEA